MTPGNEVALRRLFRVVNGGTPTSDESNWGGGIHWATPVDLGRVHGRYLDGTDRTLSDAGLRSGSAAVPAGSLIVSTRAPIGYVTETTTLTAFNQGCKGLIPIEPLDTRFYRYVAVSMSSQLQAAGQGSTFVELSAGMLAEQRFPAPAPAVQRVIADFLDTETARIDALLARKAQLVERLDERLVSAARAALMGVSETSERRDTGLPWLPDAPAGWDVAPVYSRFDVLLGRMVNSERSAAGDMRPYLRNINVRWDKVDVAEVAHMDFPPAEQLRYRLEPGNLLVCEGGAGVARAAIWRGEMEECYFQKSLHRVRRRGEWPVEWLIEWLRVCKYMGVFEGQGNLATIPHLTAEQLREHRVPMPDPLTCREILARLDKRREATAHLKRRIEDQVKLLQEHRQALITAAVTGELEVPGVAA